MVYKTSAGRKKPIKCQNGSPLCYDKQTTAELLYQREGGLTQDRVAQAAFYKRNNNKKNEKGGLRKNCYLAALKLGISGVVLSKVGSLQSVNHLSGFKKKSV